MEKEISREDIKRKLQREKDNKFFKITGIVSIIFTTICMIGLYAIGFNSLATFGFFFIVMGIFFITIGKDKTNGN